MSVLQKIVSHFGPKSSVKNAKIVTKNLKIVTEIVKNRQNRQHFADF